MWSQPWFFVMACLHLGQGLVAPFCLSLRISSLNRSSACAFSIDLRWNRERHAIDATSAWDAARHHLSYFSWCAFRAASCCITYAQFPSWAGPTLPPTSGQPRQNAPWHFWQMCRVPEVAWGS